MGHYIKITGRGYLKNIDLSKDIDWQSRFSKQLTLAYSAESQTEAEVFKADVLAAMEKERDKQKHIHDVALKLVTFPEMFDSEVAILSFLKKNKINYTNYDWYGFYKLVHTTLKAYNVKEAINQFENGYWGYKHYCREYNSTKTACDLIRKGKVVELDNNIVNFKASKKKKVAWKESANGKNKASKKWCICCGAEIPGAKYLRVGYEYVCPYCISKLGKEAEADVKRLGEEMAKAYKTAIFVGSL